jgi:hypothetical protein
MNYTTSKNDSRSISLVDLKHAFAGRWSAAGRDSISIPGPGHSREDRSLQVTVGSHPDGFLCHSYCDDDWKECRDYIKAAVGVRGEYTYEPDPVQDYVVASDAWLKAWNAAGDPTGTVVEVYLRSSRGVFLPPEMAGNVIRFHPRLWHVDSGQHLPAMVCLFRDIRTDEPCGIHRTWFDQSARKLDRKMYGRTKGAAIKLSDDEDVTLGLHIGEGIETCLTGYLAAYKPTWVLGSAGNIAAFSPLPGIECLTIFTEAGDGGANARAVAKCARLWLKAGCEVETIDPVGHDDLNDIVREVA